MEGQKEEEEKDFLPLADMFTVPCQPLPIFSIHFKATIQDLEKLYKDILGTM